MKSFLTINDIIIALFGAVWYGFSYIIPKCNGYSEVEALLICLVVGGIFDYLGNKMLNTEFFLDNTPRQVYALLVTVLCLIGFMYISWIDFQYDLFEDLEYQILYCVIIPGLGFCYTLAKLYYQKQKIVKKFGVGAEGAVVKGRDEYKEVTFNAEHQGDYDAKLGVKTATGTYLGKKGKKVVEYLGITYAKAERWQAPVPVPESDKVYEAFKYGPCCLQNNELQFSPLKDFPQSEDCLTLNVICPAKLPKNKKLPVLVSLHGGDLAYGGSASPLEDGSNFVREQKDIIYVSFNYRLEVLGFMDFSKVEGGEKYAQSGYLGILDQLVALKWIKQNIEAFGGDSDNITVCGCSGGSLCLAILATLDEAKGLFNRAFLFTDYHNALLSKEEKEQETDNMLAHFKAKTMADLLNLSCEQLQEYINLNTDKFYGPGAGLGLIPKSIEQAFEEGKAKDIDLIINIPSCEMGSWVMATGTGFTDDFFDNIWENISKDFSKTKCDAILNFCADCKGSAPTERNEEATEYYFFREPSVELVKKQLMAGGKVRLSFWDAASPVQRFGASGYGAKCMFLGNLETGYQLGCLKNETLSKVVQLLLANFVRCGNPSIKTNTIKNVKGISWPYCASDKLQYLHITEKQAVMSDEIIAKCEEMHSLKMME
ncbi:MAG: carboxylesterase family protein [Phascolarctobacterium sp.]|nr:carboxylesterase family protein [Phascolarctobacterium sp.]